MRAYVVDSFSPSCLVFEPMWWFVFGSFIFSLFTKKKSWKNKTKQLFSKISARRGYYSLYSLYLLSIYSIYRIYIYSLLYTFLIILENEMYKKLSTKRYFASKGHLNDLREDTIEELIHCGGKS